MAVKLYAQVLEICLENGSSDWDWVDNFKVKFFEPPLRMFIPPKDTPDLVSKALETSFSIFFISPSASLSTLRIALETLLEEIKVASVTKNGDFISLDKRINSLSGNNAKILEHAKAIKWLGNDGAHHGSKVSRIDVLNGYRIFKHILVELYPEKKASITPLVARINDAKGVDKKA